MEWISVKKRLPRPYSEIILYREDAGVFAGYYGSLEGLFSDDERAVFDFSPELEYEIHFYSYENNGLFLLVDGEEPTHWMPLPESPKQ